MVGQAVCAFRVFIRRRRFDLGWCGLGVVAKSESAESLLRYVSIAC
jgi:hypothetical protein